MRTMKWMAMTVLAGALVVPAMSAAEPAASPEVQKFGAPVTLKKSVNLAKIQKNPARYVGKTVRIEGVVREVCQGMGCWVEVEGPRGETFIAKSLDESVLIPSDSKGSRIVVQGSMAEMRGKGHDHAAHKTLEAGHTCPAPDYLLSTIGIELITKR